MDFAALMSAEIAKAKGGKDKDSAALKPSEANKPSTKYVLRREVEEARKAAYFAEQKSLENERAAKAAAKRKREDEAIEEVRVREEKKRRLADESRKRREEREAAEEKSRRRRLGLPEVPTILPLPKAENSDAKSKDGTQDGDDLDEGLHLPEDEVQQKLRAIGEPVTLLGEDHTARVRRLRRLDGTLPDEEGQDGPIATILPAVPEKDMKVAQKPPLRAKRQARYYFFRQLASYFNMVLREWERALALEAAADRTEKGLDPAVPALTISSTRLAAFNALTSCREAMRPLFRKFEKGDLDEAVLEAVCSIVHAAQERRYVDANDEYLRLSIGKAAWPIGVTMVGIHERSAREKLHDGSQKGHIMGGETTRKYLQSIKRCLTFAQVRWPPEDIRQLMG